MNVLMEGGVPIKMWTGEGEDALLLEDSARLQLGNISRLPFIYKHLAVMPDVHLGIGATVGSVVPTLGAIIPAAVGVDIGCGMMATPLGINARDLPDNLKPLRDQIERDVPVGNGPGGSHKESAHDLGWDMYEKLSEIKKETKIETKNAFHQLGTLGGGNHFIELCLDEGDNVWVMLHSGSRGIGNKIGMHFINEAKEDMRVHFINLPDKDLAYLSEGTEKFDKYVEAVSWAQEYAMRNRNFMMEAVINGLKRKLLPQIKVGKEGAIACHHNYISREHHFGKNIWVTRKGAVNAAEGKMGIIPGSMGQKSYLVRGKGNAESFNSCSHGAGRAMSRTAARNRFSTEDLIEQTKGVECRKDSAVVDEIPSAYKNLDNVMKAQEDLVEVVHTLKAILCVKG